jgi:hypothetical protein
VAIAIGTRAPEVEGVEIDGPRALVFFKVTCGTTKLATPAVERLARAYPGRGVRAGRRTPELQTRLNHAQRPLGLSGSP